MLFCSLGLEHLSKHSWLLWKLPNPDELIRARDRGGGAAGAWNPPGAYQVARWQMSEAAGPQLGRRQPGEGGPRTAAA